MPVLIVLFIPKDFLTDVWSEDNPDAYFPRPRGYVALDVNPRELSKPNTRYLQNVAYCRLKNVTVGYSLPRTWLKALHMERVRVYFSGENLFYIQPLYIVIILIRNMLGLLRAGKVVIRT